MGTGTGSQIAAVPHQLHTPEVDVPVAPGGILHRSPALGKGRRVEDHHIKLFALAFQLGQQVEYIGALELYPVREPVELGIDAGLIHRQLGGIHAQHAGSPRQYRH